MNLKVIMEISIADILTWIVMILSAVGMGISIKKSIKKNRMGNSNQDNIQYNG